jgi:hypothetical protein
VSRSVNTFLQYLYLLLLYTFLQYLLLLYTFLQYLYLLLLYTNNLYHSVLKYFLRRARFDVCTDVIINVDLANVGYVCLRLV